MRDKQCVAFVHGEYGLFVAEISEPLHPNTASKDVLFDFRSDLATYAEGTQFWQAPAKDFSGFSTHTTPQNVQ